MSFRPFFFSLAACVFAKRMLLSTMPWIGMRRFLSGHLVLFCNSLPTPLSGLTHPPVGYSGTKSPRQGHEGRGLKSLTKENFMLQNPTQKTGNQPSHILYPRHRMTATANTGRKSVPPGSTKMAKASTSSWTTSPSTAMADWHCVSMNPRQNRQIIRLRLDYLKAPASSGGSFHRYDTCFC